MDAAAGQRVQLHRISAAEASVLPSPVFISGDTTVPCKSRVPPISCFWTLFSSPSVCTTRRLPDQREDRNEQDHAERAPRQWPGFAECLQCSIKAVGDKTWCSRRNVQDLSGPSAVARATSSVGRKAERALCRGARSFQLEEDRHREGELASCTVDVRMAALCCVVEARRGSASVSRVERSASEPPLLRPRSCCVR